jgi:hypothetical protein
LCRFLKVLQITGLACLSGTVLNCACSFDRCTRIPFVSDRFAKKHRLLSDAQESTHDYCLGDRFAHIATECTKANLFFFTTGTFRIIIGGGKFQMLRFWQTCWREHMITPTSHRFLHYYLELGTSRVSMMERFVCVGFEFLS